MKPETRIGKFAGEVHVLTGTRLFLRSQFLCTLCGYEMYKNVKRTYSTIVLLIKTFLVFDGRFSRQFNEPFTCVLLFLLLLFRSRPQQNYDAWKKNPNAA